jgi:mono/diheme cytochrome c family protein
LIIYILFMLKRVRLSWITLSLLCCGALLGVPTHAAGDAPTPGSEGDTLTKEDRRMAYLVYKLLDKNGKIKGANLKRGEKLFYQNCRGCHGVDGHRIDFTPNEQQSTYMGQRAREDMPTFWYQMNFGDETREGMEPFYDEIELDEMVDIAGYAQTLP